MAFPLAAIGAGLGIGADQFQRAQESALRQMIWQQQYEQMQRELADDKLLGQVLGTGNMPGFGRQPFAPITGLPQGQLPGTSGMATTGYFQPQQQSSLPPAPQQPVQRESLPLDMGGTPRPADAIPLDTASSPQPTRTLTPEQQDQMEMTPGQMTPEQADALYRSAGAAESRAGVPLTQPEPIARAEPGSAPAAAAPALDTQDVMALTAPDPSQQGVQSLPEMQQMLGMFQSANPAAIAQRIKQVRPDADDGSVWRATAKLMKLSSGSLREQLAAASMMKFLMHERRMSAQSDRSAEMRQQSLGQGQQRLEQADRRMGQQAERAQQTQRRFETRLNEQRLNKAIDRGNDATKLALRSMNQQLANIKREIDAIDMGPVNPQTKQRREQLSLQYQDLLSRVEKRMNAVLGEEK